jgi:hypothetical protein
MTVIKRDRNASGKDLIEAIEKFSDLLETQSEDDAIADLRSAGQKLKSSQPGSTGHKDAVKTIIDAFEGDHELSAYILEKVDPSSWTESDELSVAATRVLNLARRLR